MSAAPRADLSPNTFAYENEALVKATGFREYDARWVLGKEINLVGLQALGLGLGTYFHECGERRVVVGHDFRSYSLSVKQALTLGLIEAGCEVIDIGLALSPTAYFAQFDQSAPCVAMVTASHNENGWTGVKMGAHPPLTFGPEEIGRLKAIVLGGEGRTRSGGSVTRAEGVAERYIADAVTRCALTRPLKVVCACGNGSAGAFAPRALRAMGAEVIEMDCDLDWTFPRYNPNPEDAEMLNAMAAAVHEHGADLALGFDGDGDRCGVVDDTGEEIFADKIGLMLARDLAPLHPGATFVVDVKSTGLFATDKVLAENGARTVYWKTGHSYIKRKTAELGALAGFEKSGHFFFNAPLGRGYDCGLTAAAAILAMLNCNPGKRLSELKATLPLAFTSLTMSPHCADEIKYAVVDKVIAEYQALAASGAKIAGRRIAELITVNGVRVALDDGSWLLVRASSNKPELVVVVESMRSADDMRALFHDEVKPRLARYVEVGAYNQEILSMRVAMIGTGYVGLVSGACFADFGHTVTCIDKDAGKIAQLAAGIMPIYEPGLDALVERNAREGRLTFATDAGPAIAAADAVFIAVGTPSRRGDGYADLSYVHTAAKEIAGLIDGFTVVVTKSTVPVGTGDEIEAIIAAVRPKADFAVVSNPEFLREGSAIEDFKRPDRVVVGLDDERARAVMVELYRPLSLNETPMLITDRRTSELIKYAANAFLAMKVTYINEMADLCEKVGADVQQVARGIGLDKRIGPKFLHAGPGYGGSCFPKDTLALVRTAADAGAPLRLVETTAAINAARKASLARRVAAAMGGDLTGKTVAVLGLTFKPNTDDMREAPALDLVPGLCAMGARVQVFDPHGDEARQLLPMAVFESGPYEAVAGADSLVMLTEWDQFRALDLDRVKAAMRAPVLIDLRNVYRPQDVRARGFTYLSVGRP